MLVSFEFQALIIKLEFFIFVPVKVMKLMNPLAEIVLNLFMEFFSVIIEHNNYCHHLFFDFKHPNGFVDDSVNDEDYLIQLNKLF